MLESSASTHNKLFFGLEAAPPDSIVVGRGNLLYLEGWCFHTGQEILRLEVVVDGVAHPVEAHSFARPDVWHKHYPRDDPRGFSFRGGFWALAPFPANRDWGGVARLSLRATLRDRTQVEEEIARIRIGDLQAPDAPCPAPQPPAQAAGPLVAICLASYNPPRELFRQQIESLINQTHQNWICIISDDASSPEALAGIEQIVRQDSRFALYPSRQRLGFYHNFERSLTFVPPAARFVMLCDQDDNWHPDKIETLLAAFDDRTTLAYSDMRIVGAAGQVFSNTYWTTRRNNCTNLTSLLLANCVTGAASMFRRELLADLLPFPPRVGDIYHDHWLSCLALSLGKIKYVARPLYDYTQHGGNVLGHNAPPRLDLPHLIYYTIKDLTTMAGRLHARAVYFYNVLKVETVARAVLLRDGGRIPARKRRALRRIARLEHSLPGCVWLALRGLLDWRRISITIGAEYLLLSGICWKLYLKSKSRLASRPRRLMSEELSPPPAGRTLDLEMAEVLRQKIVPLALHVSAEAPPRVNLLIPGIDLRFVFGGYLTKFSLARRLAREGLRVRLVIVDRGEFAPALWRTQLVGYQDVADLFEHVEVAYHFDRSLPLDVNPQDTFVATTWWTAHIAEQASRELRHARFIYLIQEYEPFTFPMGSFAAVADESYRFPHYAVFSTEFLRDYFRQQRLGVFAGGSEAGDRDSVSFDNPITNVGAVTAEELARRTRKKLLFYARPEAHAARNMFELGLAALAQAVAFGCFDESWEFYGIGTIETAASVKLAADRELRLLPRQNQDQYRGILRAHDLGLCLMYTPHPSLVPIEMAAAGMPVVTNTFANKTAERLGQISANIIAVEPTITGVARGLAQAVVAVEDYARRASGARVQWPMSSSAAFTDEFVACLKDYVARSSGQAMAETAGGG